MNPISNFFKLMFSPLGRIGRLEFFLGGTIGMLALFFTWCFIFGGLPGAFVALANPTVDQATLVTLIKAQVDKIHVYAVPLYWLGVFLPNYFFLLIKRLRATGASAWYALLGVVPFILFVALFFIPNAKEINQLQ